MSPGPGVLLYIGFLVPTAFLWYSLSLALRLIVSLPYQSQTSRSCLIKSLAWSFSPYFERSKSTFQLETYRTTQRMPSRGDLTIATIGLALGFLPLVAAHGDGEAMDMSAQDSPAPQPQDNGFGGYWSLSEHASLMYWHIGLEILAWIMILPVAVMFSIARSRYALPSQLAFLATNALALVLGVVYDHKTPEMYAGNAHSKTGWGITWIASAWVLLAFVQACAGRSDAHSTEDPAAPLMTTANMIRYQRVQDEELPDPSRWSDDSGQGTERNSASRSPSLQSENQQFGTPSRRYTQDDDSFDHVSEKRGFLRNTSVDRFFSRNVARVMVGRTLKTVRFFYIAVERTILVLGFVAIANGTVTYGGIGRGGAVFNVLAHYVKGAIFFLYGLLTLGRWMGAFADFGWAWNVKPPKEVVGRRRAALPSAEFTESFVIWLYGCTNVFMEHMAAWGDAWTAQDLEHVSISVMFFGGGLVSTISSFSLSISLSATFADCTRLVGNVHRIDEDARTPQQRSRCFAGSFTRKRIVAATAPVSLLNEPTPCSCNHAPRQDDELSSPNLDGVDHDTRTVGWHFHGICSRSSPYLHHPIYTAANILPPVSPTDRDRVRFLPCQWRYNLHDQQQGHRCGARVLRSRRDVRFHCRHGLYSTPDGVDHGRYRH
jgi:hypothetical protein